jgi:hypothetical protein
MTSMWLTGMAMPEAWCRGCERALWRAGSCWEDVDRGRFCRPGVRHEPLPAGLRGAPA